MEPGLCNEGILLRPAGRPFRPGLGLNSFPVPHVVPPDRNLAVSPLCLPVKLGGSRAVQQRG